MYVSTIGEGVLLSVDCQELTKLDFGQMAFCNYNNKKCGRLTLSRLLHSLFLRG